MTLPTMINIERLAAGVNVWRKGGDFGPFGNAAEVQSVTFDPDGFYIVTVRLIEDDGATEWVGDEEVVFYVSAGETVEFAGRGIPPFMRPETDVTVEEHDAKFAADMRAADAALAESAARLSDMRAPVRGADLPPAIAAE